MHLKDILKICGNPETIQMLYVCKLLYEPQVWNIGQKNKKHTQKKK